MNGFAHSKLLYDINEAMELLSLSRSTFFEEIRIGRLQTVKRGRSRLVPAEATDEYVALLKREAAQDTDRNAILKPHEAA